jgi:hypothetical protein
MKCEGTRLESLLIEAASGKVSAGMDIRSVSAEAEEDEEPAAG